MTDRHKPDRIWATGNSTTGSWNATEVNPRIAPEQTVYLLSTPVREAAPDMLEALRLAEELHQIGLLAAPSGLARKVTEARCAAIAKATGEPT